MSTLRITLPAALLWTGLVLFGAACGAGPGYELIDESDGKADGSPALLPMTDADRKAYLRDAALFVATDVAAMDLVNGPAGKDAFSPSEAVTCRFSEPSADNLPGTGKSPKFACTIAGADGPDEVKVKYGTSNGELYGELISSRLLWALGFGADRNYAVRVTCLDCPKDDPWEAYQAYPRPYTGPREATRAFPSAIVERKFAGKKMVQCAKIDGARCLAEVPDEKQGWSWDEVDRLKADVGGDAKVQWDAFKLLAAFMKHADNKMANQRLVCLKGGIGTDGKCHRPFILVQDGGATFGGGAQTIFNIINDNTKARLQAWADEPVWQDRRRCKANVDSRFTLSDPTVTEAARQFLAGLLAQLTPDQQLALFTAARVAEHGELVRTDKLRELFPKADLGEAGLRRLFPEEDPGAPIPDQHVVNAAVWVLAFQAKLAELGQPCGG